MPSKDTIQHHTEAYTGIWKQYETFKSRQSQVIRSGYAICDIYDKQLLQMSDQELIRTRGESDLEHAAGMAIITNAFMQWFPNLLSQDPEKRYRILFTCLTHDAGEISIGDIPNDGRLNDDEINQKHIKELAFMQEMSNLMPPTHAETFLQDYVAFSNRDGPEGYFIHLIDKLEALLQHAFYEKVGIKGISGDESPRDIAQKAITGSNHPLDNWTVDFIAEYEKLDSRPAHPNDETLRLDEDVFRHCFGILCTAAIDARGYAFNWTEAAFLACNLGIPIASIIKKLRQEK